MFVTLRAFCGAMIPGYQRGRFRLKGSAVGFLVLLFLWSGSLLLPEIGSATTIYSYIDEQGTPILTDNFERIPERYRAKVQVTERVPQSVSDHSAAVRLQQKAAGLADNSSAGLGALTRNISGLTQYQSEVLNFGGIAAVICLLARLFMRGEIVRFLSLWCLIMLGLIVPVLLFTSQDAPLDRVRGQAGKIQDKQQEHLQRTP